MTQAIFWIYSTISGIVFVIQKIELKSVILRCKTSMKTCYPGHTDWNTTSKILDIIQTIIINQMLENDMTGGKLRSISEPDKRF